MNNKFAKLDYRDVTTAAYSFAVLVIVMFIMMYRVKAVRGRRRHDAANDAACAPPSASSGRGLLSLAGDDDVPRAH